MVRLALLLVLFLAAAPAAHAGTWQRPVDGPVLRAFGVGSDPYARGQHRGVDLGAAQGSPVRSACGGPVSFAGRVPGGGLTVSVRCGAIVATYQQLGALAVRAGQRIARGGRLATVGRSGDPYTRRAHVHLGARDAASGRYLDPLSLLRGVRPGVPLVPAGRGPRAAPLGPAPASPRAAPAHPEPTRPAPVGPEPARLPASPRAAPAHPAAGRLPSDRPAPSRHAPARGPAAPPVAVARPKPTLPWTVWIGLGCVGLGLPLGGFVRLRQRRRVASHVAQTA